MSLYDKASLIFSGAAGAGNKDVAYNIKPVEKLKVDERITNGSFDNNDADGAWVLLDSPTISNNQAVFYDDSTGTNATKRIYQDNVFEDGKTYKVSFEVIDLKAGRVKVGTGFNTTAITKSDHITKSGKYSFYYTAQVVSNADARIQITRTDLTGPYDFKIDNVSVREVEQKANDFSFSRGSDLTATYEGPDGLIKKTRENLLTYSNGFDNAIWAGSSTWTSGQSGYDGSTDAWSFNKASASGSDYYNQFFHGLHTFSIYAKKQSSAGLAIYAFYDWNGSSFGGNTRVVYNLDTGTELSNQSDVISTTCEAIGSNWWRISMTVEQDDMRWYLYTTDGTQTLVDNVTVTLQDAQLEQGLVATPYIHRTDSYSKSTAGIQEDEPRYDYSLDNALPPVLMLEPERTNKLAHSEYFGDWSANGVNLDPGYEAPDGTNSAYKVSNTGGSPDPYLVKSGSVLSTDSRSIWAKTVSGTGTVNLLSYYDNTNNLFEITNEWQRFEVSSVTTTTGQTNFYAVDFRGDSTLTEVLIWGAQAEEGSCATSYIPTYGSTGTRKTDTIPQYTPSKTNLDKYTFFAHSHSDRVVADNRAPRLKGDGNSALMGIFVNAAGKKQFFLYDNENNSKLSKATFGSFEAGDDTKYAFVVDNIALEAKLFIDGVLRETISLTERVDAKIISVGNSDGNPDRIKSIMYFPEALEDADAVSLTT